MTLLLLPNVVGTVNHHEVLPAAVDEAMKTIDGLIAESPQKGRTFLKKFQLKKKPHELPLALYNEHTPDDEINFLLEPLVAGETWAFISDAGMPCIADPGEKLVARAHKKGIVVKPFVGPSSIFLALMVSGLPGQRFSFQGYLSKQPKQRQQQIRDLMQNKMTQIIMEAPYRNNHLLQDLVNLLDENVKLCVVWDIMMPTYGIISQKIKAWKKQELPDLKKHMALFLFV